MTPVSWSESGQCEGVVMLSGTCLKSVLGEFVQNTDPDWVPQEVSISFLKFSMVITDRSFALNVSILNT